MIPQDCSLWLRSIVRHDLWPLRTRFEARSTAASEFDKRNIVPEVSSQAGIYAFTTIEDAITNLDRMCYRGALLGKVHLWGVIQKHRFGYRAQYAYPHSLTHGICCICKSTVGLASKVFAIGWRSYHFSDNFSVRGFVCSVCNEKFFLLDTNQGYAELSELAERYGIPIG